MTDYAPDVRPVAEGSDIPEPIRCYMYGDGFASIDGELQMSAFGPGALATIAKKLLAIGYDGDRELKVMARAGPGLDRAPGRCQRIGKKMKFGSSDGKGGIHKGGRTPGSRTRLTAKVFEDILDNWNAPVEGRNITKGQAALEVMRKERPSEYVKIVCSLLPKELLLGDSTLADLDDGQIDTLLLTLRKQVLEHATEPELN